MYKPAWTASINLFAHLNIKINIKAYDKKCVGCEINVNEHFSVHINILKLITMNKLSLKNLAK